MKLFLKSYSALTTSVNASRAVALPTFIAICLRFRMTHHELSDIVRLPRLFLVGRSSSTACLPFVAYDEEWPTECQTCRATFSSGDKRILRGYYAYENEFQTKNRKA